MNAVDTNVVVRFLVRDDAVQARKARHLFAGGDIFLSKTVLLESEWVLRHAYELDGEAVVDGLDKLCRMVGTMIEDAPSVRRAIQWHRQGLDFADALHLASSPANATFRTFDKALRGAARKLTSTSVTSP